MTDFQTKMFVLNWLAFCALLIPTIFHIKMTMNAWRVRRSSLALPLAIAWASDAFAGVAWLFFQGLFNAGHEALLVQVPELAPIIHTAVGLVKGVAEYNLWHHWQKHDEN